MITAIICSVLIGLLIGVILVGFITSDPYPFNLEDFERERRLRAESEATRLYFELENMRRDSLRLSSYPLYQMREPFVLEIQKLPRAESLKDAKEKYGEHWDVTDGIIGKLNEVISEVNNPSIKKIK